MPSAPREDGGDDDQSADASFESGVALETSVDEDRATLIADIVGHPQGSVTATKNGRKR